MTHLNNMMLKSNRRIINKIICDVPDFKKQAHEMTKINRFLKGGNK